MFDNFKLPDLNTPSPQINIVSSGGVFNYETIAMKLTRGKLLKLDDWLGKDGWQQSEWKQLDQYDKQGMFGTQVKAAGN